MVDKRRCRACGMVHFADELHDCGAIAPAEPETETHIPYTGPLPSLDPYVQDYREKYGRAAQEDLYPETDDINGGLRR